MEIEEISLNGKTSAKKEPVKKSETKKEAVKKEVIKKETPKKTDAKVTVKKTETKKTKSADKLTKIEGIGPKIAGILAEAGVDTFKKLSETKADKISEILVAAGGNAYNRFDPTTWPEQAKLAADGKWDELQKLQDELNGGKAN
ncbi:MAG: DUF4332 domain-containing protein [Bacteroidales bacterium]|nr:DUF4332 domain-containing protein [Bacteroidales bacterium]